MLAADAKITARIIIAHIKEHLGNLIDGEQADFHSGFSYTPAEHFGGLCRAQIFASPLLHLFHLFLIYFEKTVSTGSVTGTLYARMAFQKNS